MPVVGQTLPDELRRLGAVITGPRESRSWLPGQDRALVGFHDLKGIVEQLLAGLGLNGAFEPGEHPALHPGRCAQVRVGDTVVGVMGELHPLVREAFNLPTQPVVALEFDLDKLLGMWGPTGKAVPISVHPPVYEDLAVIVENEVPAIQLRDLILRAGAPLVRSALLFDVYRGEQVGTGRKSLAYRLTYQADDATLTDQQVTRLRAKIVQHLQRELGATLRG